MDLFLSFLIFVAAATLTPGGATTLATSSGMRFGLAGSMPLILGMTAGMVVMVGASAFGLGSLFLVYPAARIGLAAVATLYFIWLAWMIARSGAPRIGTDGETPPHGIGAGAMLILVNPKAWTMALGASASFGSLGSDPLELAVILASVFAAFCFGSLSIWCVGGMLISRLLRTERQWHMLNAVLAVMLIFSIIPVWSDLV